MKSNHWDPTSIVKGHSEPMWNLYSDWIKAMTSAHWNITLYHVSRTAGTNIPQWGHHRSEKWVGPLWTLSLLTPQEQQRLFPIKCPTWSRHIFIVRLQPWSLHHVCLRKKKKKWIGGFISSPIFLLILPQTRLIAAFLVGKLAIDNAHRKP